MASYAEVCSIIHMGISMLISSCRPSSAHEQSCCWLDLINGSLSSSRKYFNFRAIWWRHQMEAFSALLAICTGNSPVTGEFPTQRPVTRSFDDFFDLSFNTRLSKQREAGDLGSHLAHYDVIVMSCAQIDDEKCIGYLVFWVYSHDSGNSLCLFFIRLTTSITGAKLHVGIWQQNCRRYLAMYTYMFTCMHMHMNFHMHMNMNMFIQLIIKNYLKPWFHPHMEYV